MPGKLCDAEEIKQIKREYSTGKYTYEQLAEIHHLSRGTAINYVRNYPCIKRKKKKKSNKKGDVKQCQEK